MKAIFIYPVILISLLTFQNMAAQNDNLIIRISEIEIDSSLLEEYNNTLKIESKASVQKEPGVIAICPMYQKERPTQIRILEIYLNKSAYENHIKSPHFQKYKTSTIKMVKSLKLVDMNSLDPETLNEIFRKLND